MKGSFMKGGFKAALPSRGGKSPAPSRVTKDKTSPNHASAKPEKKKDKDEVSVLKERLAKGHRLNDQELAQLEMAAVARWNQLQREDEEEVERQREAEAEKERQREQRLNKELKDLRSAAAADRANLERAGAAVADELRELRELRDAAAADRANLESSVAQELKELRAMRDAASRDAARRAAKAAEEQMLLSSIYDDGDAMPAQRSDPPTRGAGGEGSAPFDNDADAYSFGAPPPPPPFVPAVNVAAAGEAARTGPHVDAAASNTLTSTASGGGVEVAGATPAKKGGVPPAPRPPPKKKPPPKPPAAPLDPETMLRLAAFDDWASEQARKAERKGDVPPNRAALEAAWADVAGPIRQRYERDAALKLQRAGIVGADVGAGEPKLKSGQCSTSVANPMPAMVYEDPAGAGGLASKARVDFGRTPKRPEAAPVRRKRPPPPIQPAGSLLADLLSLVALLGITTLLVDRSYRCRPPEFEWAQLLPAAVRERLGAALTAGADRRQLWGEAPPPPPPEGGGFGGVDAVGPAVAGAVSAVSSAVSTAIDEVSAAEHEYAAALTSELDASCGHMAVWAEPGSGMLHLAAFLVGIATLVTLLRALCARLGRWRAERRKRRDELQRPLLPTGASSPSATGADGMAAAGASELPPVSLAPWTSLACAEVLLAGYAARLFAAGTSAPSTAGAASGGAAASGMGLTLASVTHWLLGAPSAAHTFVLVCSGLLLLSAARRGLQIWSWQRAYNEWLNPPPPPKPASTPKAPKVAPTAEKAAPEEDARRGRFAARGRTAGKPPATPAKGAPRKRLFPARCLCCPWFGGAPAEKGKEEGGKKGAPAGAKKPFATPGKKSMV